MKKSLFTFLMLMSGLVAHAQLDDLIFVEYMDASSGSGVVVKIYNPTPSPINMAGYTLSMHNNGNLGHNGSISLSGILAPGGVYVVKGGGSGCQAHSTIGSTGVNGNDCVLLRKGTQYIDMINLYGTDVFPRIGSVSKGLYQKKIVRANDNCIRYTSTDGTSINSWPNNSTVSVQGWIVSTSTCLSLDSTVYDPSPAVTSISKSICQGDSLLVGSDYFKTTGTYYDTTSSAFYCDSVTKVNLLVLPLSQKLVHLNICSGDSVFLQNSYRKTNGLYRDTVPVANGCDSVIVTNLIVNPTHKKSQVINICSGDSVFLEGAFRKTTGVYQDTFSTQVGCDSIVTTQLNVGPVYDINAAQTICNGDSIFLEGAWQKSTGLYSDTLHTSAGCDSIVNTSLTVLPPNQSLRSISICNEDSVFLEGQYRSISGNYLDTLVSSQGCDSILTTRLTVNNVLRGNRTITLCSGDSLYIQKAWQKQSGAYYDTLTSSSGCDSILTTNLNFDKIVQVRSVELCSGDSIYLQRSWQTQSGVYHDTLTATGGCDSILTTNLTVRNALQSSRSIGLCNGDSIYLEQSWQNQSGIYHDTLTGSNGCDSILITNLTFTNVLQYSHSIDLCTGDSVYLEGSWQTQNGVYFDTLTSSSGCDSIVSTNVQFAPLPVASQELRLCNGDTAWINGQSFLTDTSFTQHKPAPGTCDSLITYNISYSRPKADFEVNYDHDNPNMVYFNSHSAGLGLNHHWDFGDGNTSTEESPIHTYPYPGEYEVALSVSTDDGCEGSYVMFVNIELKRSQMNIPNIFTPNGDGVNDFFAVDGYGWPTFKISIFNRWGGLVFESTNVDFQWDGVFNGNNCAEGTYMYIVEGNEMLKGFLTLAR